MMYECTDRRGRVYVHGPLSAKLATKEGMRRLGVLERPFQVRVYPSGRPDLVRTVQQFEVQGVGL